MRGHVAVDTTPPSSALHTCANQLKLPGSKTQFDNGPHDRADRETGDGVIGESYNVASEPRSQRDIRTLTRMD